MAYTTVLFDLDDTLIDFSGNEYKALAEAMAKHDIDLTQEQFTIYKLINRELWQNLEKGLYTKKEILSLRFDLFFVQTGTRGDASQLNHDYLIAMGRHAKLIDGVEGMLQKLSQAGIRVAMVTNGAEMAQKIKLVVTGLDKYFKDIYISDVTGFAKPDIRFFEYVAESMGGLDKKSTLIVGDSLGSDIVGGQRFGIATCWYNHHKKENESPITPDFEIDHPTKVLEILDLQ